MQSQKNKEEIDELRDNLRALQLEVNTLKKKDERPSMISNRDPQRAYLEEAKKEIKGALN